MYTYIYPTEEPQKAAALANTSPIPEPQRGALEEPKELGSGTGWLGMSLARPLGLCCWPVFVFGRGWGVGDGMGGVGGLRDIDLHICT